MGSDTITSSSAMMMLDVPDPGPILTFRPDGTLELGAKYSWSDAARLLIQAYGNGITARIAELEAALSAATAELEMLKADFNDCNSERARHKAAREAAEAEAARLREAIHAVQDATAAYLPPDGIGAQECLNRILQATDNPTINAITLGAQYGRP